MTASQVEAAVLQLAREVIDSLMGPDASKYATEGNLTQSFDATITRYGIPWVLGDVEEKLFRFDTKGDRRDLVKAVARVALMMAWFDGGDGQDV